MMDSLAFRDLYDTYYPDVLRFVQSLVARSAGAGDVDEVVQNVFVKVAVSFDQFRGQSQLQTWLFAIARNAVRDHARQAQRSARRRGPSLSDSSDIDEMRIVLTSAGADGLNGGLDPARDPESAAIAAEERAQVRAYIDQLPVAMKTVIVCRLLSDLTVAETTEVMGWSAARVRVTYSRALRKFRGLWEMGAQGSNGTFADTFAGTPAGARECSESPE